MQRMPYLPKPIKKNISSWTGGNDPQLANFAWRNFRQWVLAEFPLCEACLLAGIANDITGKGSAQIDHIIRRHDGGALLDANNTAVLCKQCHAKKTAMERHGLNILSYGTPGALVPAPGEKERILKKLLA
jgi:5-methylcytosine-specific restriction endonuclease McrA